jgi:putative ABC transport system ATP-binding protein
MTKSALIKVNHVKKSFETSAGNIEVVHDANFEILDGSFTIIYGPSGSGKTTLLNMLIGLDPPTSGTIHYDNADMYSMKVNERAYFRAHTLGMVQQTSNWVKSLSVIDNVALPLNFLGIDSQLAEAKALKSLQSLGMSDNAKKYPSVLSGGEQQKVSMARALINDPAYIVADEPTGNLDSKSGDALVKVLRKLNKDFGRTIVLVTHNLEYLSLGDQLLLMEDGIVTETRGADIKKVANHLIAGVKNRIDEWIENE